MKTRITFLTPTYNREKLLGNLYLSLIRQTFKGFEWLIIDDGSEDSTRDMVSEWLESEQRFTIRYYRTENGGKHRAVNKGLDLAQGEILMVMDSDDILTDDAAEKINEWFLSISPHKAIKGVVANRGFTANSTVNVLFKEKYLDKSLLEMHTYREDGEYVLNGERAICFYTDFHRKYRYPEFDGEKFLTEAIVYNRMAHDGYKMRFVNDIIWIFDYKDDGLTKQGGELYLKNPRGYGLWIKEYLLFTGAPLYRRFLSYYSFTCDCIGRYTDSEIADYLGISRWIIRMFLFLNGRKHSPKLG